MPVDFNVDDPAPETSASMGTAIIGTNTIPMPRQTWSAQQQAAWEARQPNLNQAQANKQAQEEAWLYNTVADQRRIADAEKAIGMAMRFQGLRGYENAVKSGVPSHVALAEFGPKMFYQHPQSLAPAIRLAKPPITFTPQVKDIAPGVTAAQLGPAHWQVINKPPIPARPGRLTDVQRATIKDLDAEAKEIKAVLPVAPPSGMFAKDSAKVDYASKTNRLAEIKLLKQQLLGGTTPTATPAATPVRVRRKSDSKTFTYPGPAADIPTDRFEILK